MGKITILIKHRGQNKKAQKGTLSFNICKLKVFQKEGIILSYKPAPLKNGSYVANVDLYIYDYPQTCDLT